MQSLKFYKRKPETIQAICYNGDNADQLANLFGIAKDTFLYPEIGEYVVRYTNGSYEVFTKEAFEELFESV